MDATQDQIQVLVKLQELDRHAFRAHKSLKGLSQPAEAKKVRACYDEVSSKLAKVESMLSKQRRDLACLEQEDAKLREQMEKVQGKIDADHGDYRRVETWTRDMQIMGDRRAVLDQKMTALLSSIEEVEKVRDQAARGAQQLKQRERDLFDEFNRQGSELKEEIARCQAAQKLLIRRIPADLAKRYISAVQAHGGVGLTSLKGTSCEACRQVVPQNRLVELKRQAPLAECPFCGRLMIVEE